MKVTFELGPSDLKYFKAVMKDVREKYAKVDELEIVGAARSLLEKVDEKSAPEFVVERIHKLAMLIDMPEDDEWALSGPDRERVVRGIAYFAEPNDMIPDRIPVLGYLDDAIMIELVVQELEHELDGYMDFCSFRSTREKRFGKEDRSTRDEWITARRKQLHARVRRRRSRRSSGLGGGNSVTRLW